MTEHDERDEASRRYRDLPREEPPMALDAAIRAHARRAVARRQWYVPAAAAAILVLAVAVTWQVEREQPDMVAVAPAPQSPPPAEPRVLMQERAAEPQRDQAELAKRQAPAGAPAESRREAATAAAPAMRAQAFAESPERWLARIAKLRAEGKDDEADKALVEFRKRYPTFNLSPEMREKVEKN